MGVPGSLDATVKILAERVVGYPLDGYSTSLPEDNLQRRSVKAFLWLSRYLAGYQQF